MPTYEYRCRKCHEAFSQDEPLSEHGSGHPRCPHCGSDDIEQVLTPFYARTSRKS